jgi:hypothetical protein
MNRSIILYEPAQAHKAIMALWADAKPWVMAGHRLEVKIGPETRSSAQNARMWAMLTDVSRQVVWHGKKLGPEDWKSVFSAGLRKLQVVPNLDDTGFVALGGSTSIMNKREFGELMTLIEAFGAEHGVRFTTPEESL